MTTARPWFPEAAAPSPLQARKHAMADQLRQLMDDVLFLDAAASDELALADAELALARAVQAFEALPDVPNRNLHIAPVDNAHPERSPFIGRCNALASPMRIWYDGELTYGEATYPDRYEGPPGRVHGGFVVAAFDDLLGVAQSVSGVAGLTGTLEVKLRQGTPLNRRIEYEAGVTSVSGRKVICWGRSTLEGELVAEATGVFIEPRGGHPARAMREAAGLPFPNSVVAES